MIWGKVEVAKKMIPTEAKTKQKNRKKNTKQDRWNIPELLTPSNGDIVEVFPGRAGLKESSYLMQKLGH